MMIECIKYDSFYCEIDLFFPDLRTNIDLHDL